MINPQTIIRPFLPLFDDTKSRYKVYYGGRGGAKSHQIAKALLKRSSEKKLRILCTREIQKSITDSVHRLLSDKISELKLSSFFDIKNNSISGKNGSMFIFAGLRTNVQEIKSMEGIDICWVEEAQSVSEESWNILIPTIRQSDSEIWISFNPYDEDDATYTRFVINPPPDTIIKKVLYSDNPFFPEVLRKEMEYDKKMNIDKYKWIWEGNPRKRSQSVIYRFNDTVNLVSEPIIYTEGIPTYTSWDFGIGDDTAIIFYQIVKYAPSELNPKGIIINIFDEYVNSDQAALHYREIVENKEYKIERHFCDPSGKSRDADLSSWINKLSYNPQTMIKDWHFEYTSHYGIVEMVDNANDYLPYVRINAKQCPQTVEMFKKWKWKTDRHDQIILPALPVHDKYSHLGTSFYYFCINMFKPKEDNFEVLLK